LNKPNTKNRDLILIFEQHFEDTIKIKHNNKIVFSQFMKTNRQLNVCAKNCVLKFSKKANSINIQKGEYNYDFIPKKEYMYYYINTYNNGISIVYSNIERDYY
jgi:hypothetical protein